MKSLLYLSHRIPYPPDKGDKIRSYNLLERLTRRFKVYLATFVDAEEDWQYTSHLESICEQSLFVRLRPNISRILSLRGFLKGSSLSLPYYQSTKIREWIRDLAVNKKIDAGIAFSSSMAQYLDELDAAEIPSLIDFCDVDSEKWRQYSNNMRWPQSWVYSREGRNLAEEENRFHSRAHGSILISDDEAEVFSSIVESGHQKISTIMNGVDTEFFDPDTPLKSPYEGNAPIAVFVGAMDYWPNVDAVEWFVYKVLPGVLAERADFHFYIVGSKPTESVKRFDNHPNVTVTGRVEDVRPYLRFADCAVAPIRIARGVQNKVLEAMAMSRPLIATSHALEGIGRVAGLQPIDDVADWVDAIASVVGEAAPDERSDYRDYVKRQFSWEASGRQLSDLVLSATGSQ